MSDNIRRVVIESVSDRFLSQVMYRPESFGIPLVSQTGKDVKICMLDSGIPKHSSIKNLAENVNFTKHKIDDFVGHATMMAGVISANDVNIKGVAVDAKLYCAKIVDDTCRVRFDSIIAGVLWGIIKEVDIIMIPLSTDIEHSSLESVINKAVRSNICVVASVGNSGTVEFPARYDNVLSVGSLDINNKIASYSASGDFNIAGSMLETTYKDNKYAVASGTSMSAALATGICARLIEKMRHDHVSYTPASIYGKMKQMSLNGR